MELQGKIINVLEERSGIAKGSGKPYRVAQYVLETPGQYQRRMMFEVFGDELINQMNIQAGEDVVVNFSIDAREYNGRWFNTIRAYKVDKINTTNTAPTTDPLIPIDDLPWVNQGANEQDPTKLPF